MEDSARATAKAQAQKKVKLIKNLPTLPGMLTKINKLVESRDTSADDVAKLIAQDQVLSAKVLKLSNAAFYGFSRKINSVAQALVILGFNVVKGLILTSSVFDMLDRSAADLWTHSLASASVSGALAQRLEIEDAEEVNLAGLLHDLGKVVLAVQEPEELSRILDRTTEGVFCLEAEEDVLGFTHQEIGSWLADSWKLPPSLIEPIQLHHQPSKAKASRRVASIVHLADIIVRAQGLGFGPDVWVPPLEPGTLDYLGLTIDDLDEIVPMAAELIQGTMAREL